MRSIGELLYNFHWVAEPEAARSAQAYAGLLHPFLERRGIRSIVNLRGANPRFRWWHYEKRVCAELNIEHIDIPLNSRTLPKRELLSSLLHAFDTAKRPLLIKCSGGQDRTSFASALYLVHREGWSAREKARGQFANWKYLHWPRAQQRWLKIFLDYAQERAAQRSLACWIKEDYAQEDFVAWLEAQGKRDHFRDL